MRCAFIKEGGVLPAVIFMQDDTSPYVETSVKTFFLYIFCEALSLCCMNMRSLRLPDLTPIDCWLRNYLKSCVYWSARNVAYASDVSNITGI